RRRPRPRARPRPTSRRPRPRLRSRRPRRPRRLLPRSPRPRRLPRSRLRRRPPRARRPRPRPPRSPLRRPPRTDQGASRPVLGTRYRVLGNPVPLSPHGMSGTGFFPIVIRLWAPSTEVPSTQYSVRRPRSGRLVDRRLQVGGRGDPTLNHRLGGETVHDLGGPIEADDLGDEGGGVASSKVSEGVHPGGDQQLRVLGPDAGDTEQVGVVHPELDVLLRDACGPGQLRPSLAGRRLLDQALGGPNPGLSQLRGPLLVDAGDLVDT